MAETQQLVGICELRAGQSILSVALNFNSLQLVHLLLFHFFLGEYCVELLQSKHKYTNTKTQKQIHKHKNTNTNTQIQKHNKPLIAMSRLLLRASCCCDTYSNHDSAACQKQHNLTYKQCKQRNLSHKQHNLTCCIALQGQTHFVQHQ